jgi:hypothetical protein
LHVLPSDSSGGVDIVIGEYLLKTFHFFDEQRLASFKITFVVSKQIHSQCQVIQKVGDFFQDGILGRIVQKYRETESRSQRN